MNPEQSIVDKIEAEAFNYLKPYNTKEFENKNIFTPASIVEAYKAGRTAADEEKDNRIKELEEGLHTAVSVIKLWHNCNEVWDIYFNNAPEMKFIKQLLNK